MELEDSLREFDFVARVLDQLGLVYQLGGSVASSSYGDPRGTNDVDVEVDIEPHHVADLVRLLGEQFVITPEMINEALRYRRSFNLIPWESIAKIDVFVPKNRAYDRQALERRVFGVDMGNGEIAPYWVNSPEDTILRKLEWYRMGNHVSDQKWKDVLAVLKLQTFNLDLDYMQHWAPQLNVTDLLERALDEAGFSETD